ncbi:FHA domain-containing protein, partial [Bacteroides fragilis]|nr:FHA domain-containing protein [Bacteroides fragilis]
SNDADLRLPDTGVSRQHAEITWNGQDAVLVDLQDGSSRVYHVREGSNIIGRSNDADLRLPDTGVSRQHAEITWNGQDAVLVDLQ